MDKNVRNTSLSDIMPSNLLEHEPVRAAARAIAPQLKGIANTLRLDAIIAHIDELPENIIDMLAWQWRVDFYDVELNLDEKRRAVKQSIAMHRIKGTKKAVMIALRMVYASGEVSEWFEYGGRPYYFRIHFVRPAIVRTADIDRVIRIVDAVKNERSWLESIGFSRPAKIGLYHGAAISTNKVYNITPPRIKDSVIRSGTYHGAGVSVYKEVILHE